MIALPLIRELEPIAATYRRFQFWRMLAVVWGGLTGLAALLLLASWTGLAHFEHATAFLVVLAVVGSGMAWQRSRSLTPDFQWIVRQVEHRDPQLRSLLLAAIEQQPDAATGQFGYLQQRVINEALEHHRRQPWGRHIGEQLFFVQCAHHVALGLFVLILAGHAWPSKQAKRSIQQAQLGGGLTVTPGDVEVEKGNGLVVMARFDSNLPGEATLVVGATEATQRRIPLGKNLDDPVFGGSIPEVNADLLYHIEYGDKRTRDFRVTVFEHPDLVRADAKLTYPDYTKLPVRTIEDTRRVSAVEGTQLEYAFHLNKPVARAELVAKGQEPVALKPDPNSPNAYLADLRLLDSRRYELRLVDAEGRVNKVPPSIQIDVNRNKPPELKFVQPKKDLRVSPLEEIQFQAEVSDDFGLRSYGLAYSLVGEDPKLIELGGTTQPHEKARPQRLVPMESMKTEPGDLVSYYLWADDVGADGEVRRTASDIYFAEVRPFEEIFRQGQPPEPSEGEPKPPGNQQQKLAELQKQVAVAAWKLKNRENGRTPSEKFEPDTLTIKESQELAISMVEEAVEKAADDRTKGILEASRKLMEKSRGKLAEAVEQKSIDPLGAASSSAQAALQPLLKLAPREHQVVQNRNQQQKGAGGGGDQQRQLDELEFKQDETRYESQRMARAEQTPQQREELQVLNRLKELSQRQQDLNEKIKELQTALTEAKSAEERAELERRLKRLREEQQQMLADVDELRQRMDKQENQSSMAESRKQLEETRENVRNAAESLEQGKASEALAAGTRAQRELQQMREEFRQRTSSQFAESMRDLREDARDLAKKQEEAGKQIEQLDQSKRKSLGDSDERKQLSEQLKAQKQEVEKLLTEMRTVTEQAEAAEPLLSRQLYETIRGFDQEKVNSSLDNAGELLTRSFVKEATQYEQTARTGIDQLKRGVERAAESVLGDEAESLRQARKSVDELARRLEQEIARAAGRGTNGQGTGAAQDPNSTNQVARANGQRGQPGESAEAGESGKDGPRQMAQAKAGEGQKGKAGQQPQPGEGQEGQQGKGKGKSGQGQGQGEGEGQQPGEGQPGQQQAGQPPGEGQGQGQGQGQGRGEQAGQPGQEPGQQPGQQRAQGGQGGGRSGGGGNQFDMGGLRNFIDGGGRTGAQGPITGTEYVEWTDRLRDVEEMLNTPELRADAARIRDRARAERAEFKRHSKEPQWDLVTKEMLQPLITLRDRIGEELARRELANPLVPIDRDPVPPEFAERVRRYYEQLGGVEKPQASRPTGP